METRSRAEDSTDDSNMLALSYIRAKLLWSSFMSANSQISFYLKPACSTDSYMFNLLINVHLQHWYNLLISSIHIDYR